MFEKPRKVKGYYEYYFCFYNDELSKFLSLNQGDVIFSTNFIDDISNQKLITNVESQIRENEKSKFSYALEQEIEIQRGLLDKYILATSRDRLGLLRMDIFSPIVCWSSELCEYIFPVMLFFKDGRIILKYSFKVTLIEEKKLIDISENYRINKEFDSHDYFQVEKDRVKKRTPQNLNKEIYDIIESDFKKKNKKYNSIESLYVNYETLTITEINEEGSNDKYRDFFLHVAHAPVDTIVSTTFEQCGIELGYGEFLVTPKKSVLCYKAEFTRKLKDKNITNKNEILLASLGAFYPALFKTLLKKYRLMYSNGITFQEKIIEKKNSNLYKKEYLFSIYETDIIYSYYDSVIMLTENVDKLMIPERTMKLIEELSDSRAKYEGHVLDLRREKTESFFTVIAFILTLVLSFEAIESMMGFFGFWKYSFIVYLIFNAIIFIGYFIFKWKLKRK